MVEIYLQADQADILLAPAGTFVDVFPQSRSNYSKFGHIRGRLHFLTTTTQPRSTP